MNNELLLLIKRHTDTLIEQTKTEPQKTLEYIQSQEKETFSFSPQLHLAEERKFLSAVTSFEATKSVINKNDENNSF